VELYTEYLRLNEQEREGFQNKLNPEAKEEVNLSSSSRFILKHNY
jgi:hypothetical protein